jgi:hypothetical protein
MMTGKRAAAFILEDNAAALAPRSAAA